jgi:hypothetical protein
MRPSLALLVVGILVVGLVLTGPSGLARAAGEFPGGRLAATGPSDGNLVLQVTPATASVTLNGTPVSLDAAGAASVSLPPGEYSISVTAPGDLGFLGNFTVTSGQSSYLTVHLTAAPSPSGGSTLSLDSFPVAVTATVVGVAVIAVLGIVLLRSPRRKDEAPPPPETRRDEGPE